MASRIFAHSDVGYRWLQAMSTYIDLFRDISCVARNRHNSEAASAPKMHGSMACAGVALRLCPQRGYAFNVFEPATLRVLAQGTLFPGAHLLGESWGLVEPAKTATCCIILSLQPCMSESD